MLSKNKSDQPAKLFMYYEANRHTDYGEARSAASWKQGDRVRRSCNMALEKDGKNENLFWKST